MPKNNNISEEDYLDSLLRSVSGQTEDFDLDKELGITDEFDSDFETEFEAQLEKEFAIEDTDSEITTASLFDEEETVPIEINSKNQETEMAESNSIFKDDDTST